MNSFFQTKLSFSDRQRIDNLETFEEFEEFHLKCAHYVLICASQGIVTRGPLHNVDEAKISDLYCSSPYSLFHLVPQFGNVLRLVVTTHKMIDTFLSFTIYIVLQELYQLLLLLGLVIEVLY